MRTPYANRPVTPPNLNPDRAALLTWARTAPLVYGRDSWRAFKALYKQAEQSNDPELLSALIARIDALSLERPELPDPRSNSTSVPDSLNAYQNRLLLRYQTGHSSFRLEIRGMYSTESSTTEDRIHGKSAESMAWLGTEHAVCAYNTRRQFEGTLSVFSFEDASQTKQIATLTIGTPISIAATKTHAYVLAIPSPSGRDARGSNTGIVQYLERVVNPRPAARASVLSVIDLSNPYEPVQIAMLDVPDAVGMSLSGSHLVIATTPGGRHWLTGQGVMGECRIFDVSDPSHPRALGRVPIENPVSVAATEHRAYILSQRRQYPNSSYGSICSISVIDTSRPDHLRLRGTCELPRTALQTLSAQGDYVYALSAGYPLMQLHCVDCSDPAKPAVIKTLDVASQSYQASGTLDTHGANVYIGTGTGIVTFDMTDPRRPFRMGDPPSPQTIAYMKRRARRALRILSRTDANTYVETAFALLTVPDAQGESLDPATQWAAYDVLYGAGRRFTQAHHGRGALKTLNSRLPRTPEYPAPDAWRLRPDLATRLFDSPNRPWQTYDAAMKMLRAARAPTPSVTQENLARFLRSESPLLIRQAARSVAERALAGEAMGAVLIADAWYLGNAAVRRALAARIGEVIADTRLAPGFAARLFERATEHRSSDTFSRRQETALLLLAARFPRAFFGKDALPSLGWLLTSNREEIIAWTLGVFANGSTDLTPDWIAALEPVEPKMRQRAFDALLASIAGRSLDAPHARALVFADTSWKREAGWRAVAASATPSTVIHNLWDELFNAPDDSEALATALATPAALATLDRTAFTPEQILSHLQSRPALARLLAPEAFATFALSLPARALLPLLATVSENSWQALRPGLLAVLQDPARSLAFWHAAWTVLPEQSDTVLESRILSDKEISETFLMTRDPEFLKTSATVFGPLLMRWAQAHTDLFPRGSADLLAAATHALPEIRSWGLDRVQSLGLDLPFALRLMESELSASVGTGQTYFEAAENVMETAMALCDSPVSSVRAYGQARIALHWSGSHQTTQVLEHLCENPHPEMQAFLAQLLLDVPLIPEGAAAFDRAVLRSRGRARPAKELVKKRGSQGTGASPEDMATLLEVARSRTPRDAEWALSRLAALAVAGQEIDGVTIDGAAGV